MEISHHSAQHALRQQLRLVTIKGQQIMEVERNLGAANQVALGSARRQVGIAQRGIVRHLVQVQIDVRLAVSWDGWSLRHHKFRPADVLRNRFTHDLAQRIRDCRNRQIVAHRPPPLRARR